MSLNTLWFKIVTCIVAGLTLSAFLLLLGNGGTITWLPPVLVFSLVGISLFVAITFPFIWQYQENREKLNSSRTFSHLHALIRYSIAFNLASFGWKKLLGLQFIVPLEIASKPMNQQSGEWLTWYYFGHSTTYGIIIAAIQITGAYFLLFRRTMLLAEIILFSLMLNLTLINIFYGMNAGALLQSVVITTGLIFLVMLEYKRLVDFFLKAASQLPSVYIASPTTKNILRLSAITLSLIFTLYLKVSSGK